MRTAYDQNETDRPSSLSPCFNLDDYADVVVMVRHPYGAVEVPLREWMVQGPGQRPYVSIASARRISSGVPVPLKDIPAEYHNTPESRRLQRLGRLPTPWGRPPDEPN